MFGKNFNLMTLALPLLFLCFFDLFHKRADALKGLLAQVVFHLTGVNSGLLRGNTEVLEQPGNGLVPPVYAACDLHAAVVQGDGPVGRHGDISALPQLLHGNTDTGLGVSQLVHDVNGTDRPALLLQDQDGFQVVLSGFMEHHD